MPSMRDALMNLNDPEINRVIANMDQKKVEIRRNADRARSELAKAKGEQAAKAEADLKAQMIYENLQKTLYKFEYNPGIYEYHNGIVFAHSEQDAIDKVVDYIDNHIMPSMRETYGNMAPDIKKGDIAERMHVKVEALDLSMPIQILTMWAD